MTQTQKALPFSSNSGNVALLEIEGSREPRISTPPLVDLTRETSYGFDVIEFADSVLHEPLLPWQQDLVIRIGELLPDGTPRFKKVLIVIARQNGKTHFVKVLSLFWLFIQQVELVAGTSSTVKMAREAWWKAIQSAQGSNLLRPLIAKVRMDNNDPHLRLTNGSRYMAAAANESSLRGYTVDRLIIDELRLHKDYKAWDSAVYTVRTKPHSQVICITNAGYDDSIVLNELRESAIQYVESDGLIGDSRLGIFEWSAPDGADPMDSKNWAAANPSLGVLNPQTGLPVLDPADMHSDAIRATNSGGPALVGFLTEALCMRVPTADPAVEARSWLACYLPGVRIDRSSPYVWGFDVNRASNGATLVAAQKIDGMDRLEVIGFWEHDQMEKIPGDLLRLLKEYKPKALYWFPSGPAATYAALLKTQKIPGVRIEELSGEINDAVMGFADAVLAERIQHDDDPRLTDHVTGAQKLWSGDKWKFSRKGKGSSDAAYAAAAAWMGLQMLPQSPGRLRLIGPDDEGEE